jgi:uncharacterized protein
MVRLGANQRRRALDRVNPAHFAGGLSRSPGRGECPSVSEPPERLCSARPWEVVIAAALLAGISTYYAVSHFAITTNVNQLVSSKSPAFARESTFEREFPARDIVAVVESPTPELAKEASERLVHRLSGERDHIRRIWDSEDPQFFSRNGLLYLPMDQVAQTTQRLERAEPVLAALAADPSLRGIVDVLRLGAEATVAGQIKPDSLDWPLLLAERTLADVLADRPASFSWQVLVQGHRADPSQLRHFVQVEPILNFAALRPGRAASTTVLRAAAELKLAEDFQAKVRLTGSVPISDEEFSTIRHGAVLNTAITIAGVLIILWLALRSIRIIAALFFALMVGLALTCGAGLAMVGSFNLISAAFAVLFVGLGVDFAVQFSVRYRSERHDLGDLHAALLSGASKAGGPLALAAAATALAFFSFIPSQYKGIADLGQIAGVGMLIAFICSITLLPALLALLEPPPEPKPMGFPGWHRSMISCNGIACPWWSAPSRSRWPARRCCFTSHSISIRFIWRIRVMRPSQPTWSSTTPRRSARTQPMLLRRPWLPQMPRPSGSQRFRRWPKP